MPLSTVTFRRSESFKLEASKVYYRVAWADDWTELANAHCLQATWSVAPQLSSAHIYYRYGWGVTPGEHELKAIAKRADVARLWIKITFPSDYDDALQGDELSSGSMKWYGTIEIEQEVPDAPLVIPETDPDILGWFPDAEKTITQGRQTFVCYGLEKLLHDKTVTTSHVDTGSGFFDHVGRGIPFNEFGQPNKSSWSVGDLFGFASYSDTGDYWSSSDILSYLLAYQMPTDQAGATTKMPWNVPAGSWYPLPQLDRPVIETHGVQLSRILDALLSRHRLAGYAVRVSETDTPHRLEIVPFTFAATDVSLPAGEHITANATQLRILLDDDPTARHTLQTDHSHVVDQVRMMGARRRSCFSVSYDDGNLSADWTDADLSKLTDLLAAADQVAGAETRDRELLQAIAAASPEVAHVYARFKISDRFAGQTGEAPGDPNANWAVNVQVFPDDDNPTLGVDFYRRGLALLPRLPLRRGLDYSSLRIQTKAVHHTGEDLDAETPVAVYAYRAAEKASMAAFADRVWFSIADGAGQAAVEEGGTDDAAPGLDWSGSVTVEPQTRSLQIRVVGAPQRVLAGAVVTVGNVAHQGFDWQKLVATVAVEEDRYCEAAYPEELTDPMDVARILVIDAGPSYRLDYVVPGTVVGINPTTLDLQRSLSGGHVRDDRDQLKEMAKLAWEWYGKARTALEWSTTWPTDLIRVGDLVRYLGPQATQREINSVVTQISIRSEIATGDQMPTAPTISYSTQFGELDFIRA